MDRTTTHTVEVEADPLRPSRGLDSRRRQRRLFVFRPVGRRALFARPSVRSSLLRFAPLLLPSDEEILVDDPLAPELAALAEVVVGGFVERATLFVLVKLGKNSSKAAVPDPEGDGRDERRWREGHEITE